jgi:hypothetical protein
MHTGQPGNERADPEPDLESLRLDLAQAFARNAEVVEELSGPDLIRIVLKAVRDAAYN